MNSRTYNKLYLPKNRERGNEKLLLGYRSNVTEIRLRKDHETYFHVPIYSAVIDLTGTSLITDGAVGGSFPAASDRISQSRKNYGSTTNNGPMLSSVANGLWFCSWLYKDPNGAQQWMDRYYNPGSFNDSVAVGNLLYTVNNPTFRDVPSTLTLQPGVLYKYNHIGEQTALELVDTFSGSNEEYIAFNLTEWDTDQVDVSKNELTVSVNSQATNLELYPELRDPQRVDQKLISFNHNHDAECYISWDDELTVPDEFTLSFWVRSDAWSESPTTQLAGNYSSKGGVGVFIDSLSSFPLFVVPETFYGHVLIVNEDGVGITDKLTKLGAFDQYAPEFVCVDTNNNVIVCHDDDSRTINKLNHLGIILKSTKNYGFGFNLSETVLGVFCATNNDIWVATTERVCVFDTNLVLISQSPASFNSTSILAFSSDPALDTFGLVSDDNCLDMKFDEQTKWTIDKTDYNLYKNDELFYSFGTPASKLQIDPRGRIWVLHGNNDISILNTSFAQEADKLAMKIDIGTNVQHTTKHITFLQTYDRSTQGFEWVALIRYADETVMYMVDLNGLLFKTINLNTLYRNQILKELEQDPLKFEYLGKGDFSGYDQRRVFKALSPFLNNQQLILKASLRDFNQTPNDYSIFTCQCPIDSWDNKSWQNVVVTYQNKQFKLFVNGNLKSSFAHSGRYGLSFEQQPSWFFGTPVGYKNGFNKEINHPSMIFNGYLQSTKLYKRRLTDQEISLMVRSNVIAEDIFWTLPTPITQYVEQIERMFKHKLPGSKSPLYRIKLSNFPVEDPVVRTLVEEEIKKIVSEMNPGYVDFVEVQWL